MAEYMDGVKDGLVNLGKIVSDTAEVVVQKTEETVEVNKLKAKILRLDHHNNKDYKAIGQIVYDQFVKNGETEDAFAELCAAIATRKEAISEYREQIAVVRGLGMCRNCNAYVAKDNVYCPKCGTKIESEFEEE